jgi:hypothetical protein
MQSITGFCASTIAIVLGASACDAFVDVDRYRTATASSPTGKDAAVESIDPPGAYDSLELTFLAMRPHIDQLFEYRVIDSNNFIQSRGFVKPLGAENVTINAPYSVPKVNGPFHLDFWADVQGLGYYNGIGSVISNDHAWRIDPLQDYPSGSVTHVDGLVQVTFTHNTSFTDINQWPVGTMNPSKDTGLGATLHVLNAGGFQGDLIQVRIFDTDAKRTVGLYRIPKVTQSTFDMVIPGVVESGAAYAAMVYVDANGNGMYDNPAMPGGDLGWSVAGVATDTGLVVTVDGQMTASATVDVGGP